jgi:hypothetical protein
MAHDAGVSEMARHRRLLVFLGQPAEIEAVEGGAEIVALAQDGQPRQAGLEAFEAQLLEQPVVVAYGQAPFLVVITQIIGQAAMPPAARQPVLAGEKPVRHRLFSLSLPSRSTGR